MELGVARSRGRAGVGLLQVCAAGVLGGTGGVVVSVVHERDGLGAREEDPAPP